MTTTQNSYALVGITKKEKKKKKGGFTGLARGTFAFLHGRCVSCWSCGVCGGRDQSLSAVEEARS